MADPTAPAPTPTSPDAGGGASAAPESNPFETLMDDTPAASEASPPPSAEPPQSAPVETPPAAPEPVATQPVQPLQPPQPPQEPPAAEEPLDPQWQEKGLAQLAQAYRLSEEQARRLEEDPAGTLPELAARVNMNVMIQFGSMMQHYTEKVLPQVIQQRIDAATQRTRVESVMEGRVYSKYPELRQVPPEAARMLAQVLRQRFPKASFEEGVREYAKAAYAMYGWQLPGETPQSPPPAATPSAAAPPPYQPAMPGGMTPPPQPNGAGQGGNPFADLIDPQ